MKRTNVNGNDTDNQYVKRLRKLSPILNPAQRNTQNISVVEHDIQNLQSNIFLIEGGTSEPGKYWDSERKAFIIAYLPSRKNDLKKIEEKYKIEKQTALNNGDKPLTEWPEHLLQEKKECQARILIYEEEVSWLKEKIKKAEATAEANKINKSGINPDRRQWGAGKLKDGILVEVAGQKVSPNKSGILEISDPNSPYFSMPVWKWKAEVVNPMFAEFRLRCRNEDKAALLENRPKKAIAFPPAPIFDKKSGNIEYYQYSSKTLSKLKK
jgi:hypothetical protein